MPEVERPGSCRTTRFFPGLGSKRANSRPLEAPVVKAMCESASRLPTPHQRIVSVLSASGKTACSSVAPVLSWRSVTRVMGSLLLATIALARHRLVNVARAATTNERGKKLVPDPGLLDTFFAISQGTP